MSQEAPKRARRSTIKYADSQEALTEEVRIGHIRKFLDCSKDTLLFGGVQKSWAAIPVTLSLEDIRLEMMEVFSSPLFSADAFKVSLVNLAKYEKTEAHNALHRQRVEFIDAARPAKRCFLARGWRVSCSGIPCGNSRKESKDQRRIQLAQKELKF
jgi:hypothetical protein